MRVGVRMLVVIRYHMSIQATTTGVLVGFTTSRCMAATGHLVQKVAPVVTTCICIVHIWLKRIPIISASGSLCVVFQSGIL
ncbi:hypothetical protein IKE88_00150 [Candidatus Saccharibacteria bacterium]|nr:hypothetical protein [Candidatus Saccharibacteria bacterium]